MTKGSHYELLNFAAGWAVDRCGDVKVVDDNDQLRICIPATSFRWISRPQGESA